MAFDNKLLNQKISLPSLYSGNPMDINKGRGHGSLRRVKAARTPLSSS